MESELFQEKVIGGIEDIRTRLTVLETKSKEHEKHDEEEFRTNHEWRVAITEKIEALPKLFVLKAEFFPVRNIVYGFVGVVLVAVIGALLGMVIRGGF